jgi:hypothetical protein
MEEVHAARMEVSARCGHNILKMLADHREIQKQFADRIVTTEPSPSQLERCHESTSRRSHRRSFCYGINYLRLLGISNVLRFYA